MSSARACPLRALAVQRIDGVLEVHEIQISDLRRWIRRRQVLVADHGHERRAARTDANGGDVGAARSKQTIGLTGVTAGCEKLVRVPAHADGGLRFHLWGKLWGL